jgi:hypothetical protein
MGWTIRGSIPGRRQHILLFSKRSRKTLGSIQYPIQRVPGQRDADNVPQFSTEFMNEWSYTSAPRMCFYVTHRNNSVFTCCFQNLFTDSCQDIFYNLFWECSCHFVTGFPLVFKLIFWLFSKLAVWSILWPTESVFIADCSPQSLHLRYITTG